MNLSSKETTLILCTSVFFSTMYARLSISPIVPFLVDDFGISNTLIGLGLSGMWIAYGSTQFISGILADRYGENLIILFAVGGTAILSLLLSFSPSYTYFIFILFILGGIAGFHYVVAIKLFTRVFDKIGFATGVHAVGGTLAGLVAPPISAWIGTNYGWRVAIVLSGIIGVFVFILFYLRSIPSEPQKPNEKIRDSININNICEILSRPSIILPLTIATIGTYVVQAILSFLPVILVELHGFTPYIAGILFSVYFIVKVPGQVCAGRISDMYGPDIVIAYSMIIGSIGLPIFMLNINSTATIIGIIFISISSTFFVAIDPRIMNVLSREERGVGFGAVRSIYQVVGATGSVGVGLTADLFGWSVTIGTLSVLLLLCFVLIILNRILSKGY